MCPGSPGCKLCKIWGDQMDFHCVSNNAGFGVLIQPANNLVTITCHGDLDWMYFRSIIKNRIRAVLHLKFINCEPPKTKLAAVMEEFQVDEVLFLDFQSLKNGVSLTKETLRGFNNIHTLTLSFSNFSSLTEDLLENLKNLKYVKFIMCNLDKVPKNFFGNSNLRSIDLSSNCLETFEVQTFDRLANLEQLVIKKNKLRNLLPHTFDGLTSLTVLNMYENFLESLPKEIFKKMRKLKALNLGRNNFTRDTLPGNLLQDNIELKEVIMSNNRRNMMSFPNGFFANLTELENVRLHNNGLVSLPEDLFRGTSNLKNVILRDNFLKTLPSKIFKETAKISDLNLSFNEISDLPDDVFWELRELERLDLSRNYLTSVSE